MNRLIRIEIHEDDAGHIVEIFKFAKAQLLANGFDKKSIIDLNGTAIKFINSVYQSIEKGEYTQLPTDPSK